MLTNASGNARVCEYKHSQVLVTALYIPIAMYVPIASTGQNYADTWCALFINSILHVATSIQASWARYSVGAMPTLYTTVLRVTTSIQASRARYIW